jgi:2,4-dienoyl-CoA reductase-like NADH-dependent reductase (Old Yellow Enzyme family)
MSVLFTPLQVATMELVNRVVIAPMCQYSADSGCMTDWHLIHLGHLALSGCGVADHRGDCGRARGTDHLR